MRRRDEVLPVTTKYANIVYLLETLDLQWAAPYLFDNWLLVRLVQAGVAEF